MQDREKQIEEMRNLVLNGFQKANFKNPYTGEPYPYFETQIRAIAQEFYDHNYRKMDEVTLNINLGDCTPEQINEIMEKFSNAATTPLVPVPKSEEQIRKEVAKEIIGELKGDMAIATFTFNPTLASELKTIYLRLQKEYGVEE